MIVKKKLVPALKKVMFTATAVIGLIRCSEEELVAPAVTEDATVSAASVTESAVGSISSLTVSGVNTLFASAKDCKTCTFVVPEGTEVIDAKEMGFQAGNVICLNALYNYGNLEFVNFEGTEENPIVITTVGAVQATESVESADNEAY